MIKPFLWGGKRTRMNLEKLYDPRENGGLGVPNSKLHYLSFEMDKLAKYWDKCENKQEWLNIETDICSTFNPKDKSQKVDTTNPFFLIPVRSGKRYINCLRFLIR